jgi:hypothetical protein
MIPADALEKFKNQWVEAEDVVNNMRYPQKTTYFISDFLRLTK